MTTEKNMLLIRTTLRPSQIHGIGCFTEEKIRKGQVIWELDERLDLVIPVSELAAFPEPIREFLKMHGYAEEIDGQLALVLCGDNARHFNHSGDPNLIDTDTQSLAARDIGIGEELTCDYYAFDLDVDYKLS
jgi:uncharacterized protein